MPPEEFVSSIYKKVVTDGIVHYDEILSRGTNSIDPKRIRNWDWHYILKAYETMNDGQRAALKLMARQATVDTISYILGIIDGPVILPKFREDFVLTYGDPPVQLNGDLQDIFLALEEEEAAKKAPGIDS